jgi:hypothetical protein
MHMYVCEHTNICRLKPEAVVLVVHQAIRSEHFMLRYRRRGVEARHNVLYRAQEEKEFFFMKDKKGLAGVWTE